MLATDRLDVLHREARDGFGGWTFTCGQTALISGGGRTYEESVEAATHAVRRHLSRRRGYAVGHDQAVRAVRHVRLPARRDAG